MRVSLDLPPEMLDALAEQVAALLDARDADRWMTVPTAAKYLDCSTHAIYRLRANGEIPFVKGGGRVLCRRSDIDRWLKEQT